VFEGKYGKEFGTMLFAVFVGDPDADQFCAGTFLEWAKINKRSWKHDQFRVRALLQAFKVGRWAKSHPWRWKRLRIVGDTLSRNTIQSAARRPSIVS